MTAAIIASRTAALSRFVDGEGDLTAIELLRIAAGGLLLLHLRPFLSLAREGVVYSDRFTQPYASFYPEASRTLYLILLWAAVPIAVAISAGFATRVATIYGAGFVGYNLFLSRTHFAHNRFFLLMLLTGIAFLPLGRRWAVDAALRRRRGRRLQPIRPLWPVFLMRMTVVAAFIGSGTSKLIDQDWWNGTVTQLRIVQFRGVAADRGVPEWLLDIVATNGFHVWFAKAAVLTELVIGLGLLVRRARLGAIWIAIPFHVSIQIVASVEVFSYAALAALVIWITPIARDRTVMVAGDDRRSRRIASAVKGLDWAGRFRILRKPASDPGTHAALSVIDRGGSSLSRGEALAAIGTRLPATFWFAAPVHAIHRLRRRTKEHAPSLGPQSAP
ncbi:MAG: HTTM domain-containing protein [Acidimicrobiia bacterium]